MKKFLTLPNLVKCLAVVLGVVAFCLMFADQLVVKSGNSAVYLPFADALFGGKVTILFISATYKGAVLSFVGYLLIVFAALLTGANLFVTDKTANKLLPFVNGALFITGGVFVILEASLFNSANNLDAYWSLAIAPIIAAVLAWVAGLCDVCSCFLAGKK